MSLPTSSLSIKKPPLSRYAPAVLRMAEYECFYQVVDSALPIRCRARTTSCEMALSPILFLPPGVPVSVDYFGLLPATARVMSTSSCSPSRGHVCCYRGGVHLGRNVRHSCQSGYLIVGCPTDRLSGSGWHVCTNTHHTDGYGGLEHVNNTMAQTLATVVQRASR